MQLGIIMIQWRRGRGREWNVCATRIDDFPVNCSYDKLINRKLLN